MEGEQLKKMEGDNNINHWVVKLGFFDNYKIIN
jgi:hypothetical protein